MPRSSLNLHENKIIGKILRNELQKQFHYLDIDKDESAPFEEIDPELEARKRQRRDDALGF